METTSTLKFVSGQVLYNRATKGVQQANFVCYLPQELCLGGAVYVKDASFDSSHTEFSQNVGTETAGEIHIDFTSEPNHRCTLHCPYTSGESL